MNKIKICFLSVDFHKGSTIMRGKDLGKFINKTNFFESICLTFDKFNFYKFVLINKYDIFIFVKYFNLSIFQYLKNKNKTIIFDCIDNFNFEGDIVYKYLREFDKVICNTNKHKKILEDTYSIDNCVIIPHHHSNFDNIKKEIKQIATVGYIGNKDQFCLSEQIVEKLKDSYGFYISEKSPRTSLNAIKEAFRLDLKIIYLSKKCSNYTQQYFDQIVNFKPSQKLLLFFSLGIPVVFKPYESNIEIIQSVGFSINNFLIANKEEDIVDNIEKLNDNRILEELILKQFIVAEQYHISNVIANYYLPLIISLYKGQK